MLSGNLFPRISSQQQEDKQHEQNHRYIIIIQWWHNSWKRGGGSNNILLFCFTRVIRNIKTSFTCKVHISLQTWKHVINIKDKNNMDSHGVVRRTASECCLFRSIQFNLILVSSSRKMRTTREFGDSSTKQFSWVTHHYLRENTCSRHLNSKQLQLQHNNYYYC